MFKTQKQHEKFWQTRQIDWKTAYFDTWNHPHRQWIINYLKSIRFKNLVEIGCASGPNLFLVAKNFPGIEIGGCDISKQAIKTAQELLGKRAVLYQGGADNLYFGDKTTDTTLCDMTLIYVANINQAISEIARITKRNLILCEFHSTNPLKRWALKFTTGYRAYNYKRLLEKHGFYDIEFTKITESMWPGGEPQKTFGYFITAHL